MRNLSCSFVVVAVCLVCQPSNAQETCEEFLQAIDNYNLALDERADSEVVRINSFQNRIVFYNMLLKSGRVTQDDLDSDTLLWDIVLSDNEAISRIYSAADHATTIAEKVIDEAKESQPELPGAKVLLLRRMHKDFAMIINRLKEIRITFGDLRDALKENASSMKEDLRSKAVRVGRNDRVSIIRLMAEAYKTNHLVAVAELYTIRARTIAMLSYFRNLYSINCR